MAVYPAVDLDVYRLNFPDCLPAMYTEREDVSPSSHGKGFLGALFFGSPSTVDKDELCK